jgi:hypothetical protein
MAANRFAFVEVNTNGRVTDKNHLHTIRKHIMKDIGKARRKKVPWPASSEHEAKSKVKDLHRYQAEDNPVVPVPHAGFLGSGRLDPFLCYPVPVDMEILFLIFQ